ncbi:MAG: hypothetical protein J6C55_01630 [Oscillospiraceae bacterium]|nr:hypothetical protein [Oscillospiraceae bacterium]
MSNKLFGNNIEPACEYCSNGKKSESGMILCLKLGVVSPSFCCKKFEYDPLKRKPKKHNHRLPKYSAKDFEI